jgi:hypothetical protein
MGTLVVTDRDREMAVAWLKASCTVASALVIMDLANQFADAREEGRLAEREKWIALAGPYWRTGREISPLALLAAARREAIEECAKIADGGAALLDGIEIEIKFVTPEKLATDLAKDIADGIRSLGKEPT